MQLAKEITWTENNRDHLKPSCDDGLDREIMMALKVHLMIFCRKVGPV